MSIGRTSVNGTFARRLRLERLYHHGNQRLLVVPLDHSVTDGPITSGRKLDCLVGQLSDNGVDAVILHKGAIRYIDPRRFTGTSLILHLSASTVYAPDPDAKYLVLGVEESLRLGADAVSMHVNLGSRDEMRQIRDLATVSEACDRWSVPLLAMIYPRGPKIENSRGPDVVAHAASLAVDLGVDILKTNYVGSVAEMADITCDCPIPILVAGGPRRSAVADVLSYVDEVLKAGVAGVAMGRNVFQAPDPGAIAREISDRIHGRGRR